MLMRDRLVSAQEMNAVTATLDMIVDRYIGNTLGSSRRRLVRAAGITECDLADEAPEDGGRTGDPRPPVVAPGTAEGGASASPPPETIVYARRRGSKLVHRYAQNGAEGPHDVAVCGVFLGIRCEIGPRRPDEHECDFCEMAADLALHARDVQELSLGSIAGKDGAR